MSGGSCETTRSSRHDEQRGYLVVELGRDHLVASLRGVSTVQEKTSPIATVASWRVDRGSNAITALH